MYEHRSHPLQSRREFARRLLRHGLFALAFMIASLAVGIGGYHHFEHLSYLDSLLNASMILGGMGPVAELHTDAGKLFASFYALFSGVFFLVIAGVLFAPMIHRFLHKFHLEMADGEASEGRARRAPDTPTAPTRERRPADEPSREDQ
jgi:hypothetical protein